MEPEIEELREQIRQLTRMRCTCTHSKAMPKEKAYEEQPIRDASNTEMPYEKKK